MVQCLGVGDTKPSRWLHRMCIIVKCFSVDVLFFFLQSSPFAMKDVTSRGAQISFQGARRGSGGGRRNPNAVGPKRK